MALIDKLTDLGDAIREQTGGTEPLTLEAMAVTIRNLDFSKTTPINVVPSTNSSFTYDGTEKTPVWQNFDSEQLTISGTTSATNAGTHTVYFTPKAGYTWADETVESKTVTWSIAKAVGTLSLSATSGTISGNGVTQTVNVNYNGDAKILVESSNTAIATASTSGNVVTLTSVSKGSVTITVSVEDSNNYTTPNSVTYSLIVDYLWLYKSGNQYSSTTGGWKAVQGDTYGNMPTINSSSMTITRDVGGDLGALYTNNKIKIPNSGTLNVVFSNAKNPVPGYNTYIRVGVTSSNTQKGPNAQFATYGQTAYNTGTFSPTSGTLTCDLSSLAGSNYYICLTGKNVIYTITQVYIS